MGQKKAGAIVLLIALVVGFLLAVPSEIDILVKVNEGIQETTEKLDYDNNFGWLITLTLIFLAVLSPIVAILRIVEEAQKGNWF